MNAVFITIGIACLVVLLAFAALFIYEHWTDEEDYCGAQNTASENKHNYEVYNELCHIYFIATKLNAYHNGHEFDANEEPVDPKLLTNDLCMAVKGLMEYIKPANNEKSTQESY